jgi:predicted transcriptional regulator
MVILIMEYDIKDIKHIRSQLGLTQSELADRSGVSQSLIAKLESGLIDPGYSSVKKIFETLDSIQSKNVCIAKDLMQKQMIVISSKSSVKEAVDKMRKNAISQLPVVDKDILLGLINESDLLDALLKDKPVSNISDIMKDAPPTVSETASLKVIVHLLKFYSIVVVVDKGKFKGVITKADVLNKMH